MIVNIGVVGDSKIAAEEQAFDTLRKLRTRRQDVLEITVLVAMLAHQDLAVLFNDLGFDFSTSAGFQCFQVGFSPDDLAAYFRDALRTQGISGSWKSQRRSAALIALQ